MIATTYRCPDGRCREACEQDADDPTMWQHAGTGTPACGQPERIEVSPDKARWSGRLWRLYEARNAAEQNAHAEAGRIVARMESAPHCGDCAAALRMSIAGGLRAAFEAGHTFGQDEYLRPHPADREPVGT